MGHAASGEETIMLALIPNWRIVSNTSVNYSIVQNAFVWTKYSVYQNNMLSSYQECPYGIILQLDYPKIWLYNTLLLPRTRQLKIGLEPIRRIIAILKIFSL